MLCNQYLPKCNLAAAVCLHDSSAKFLEFDPLSPTPFQWVYHDFSLVLFAHQIFLL